MTRRQELERDRQVADLKAVLRSSAQPPAEQPADDGEVGARTLDGFGDGFEPPRAAWRARLVRQRGSIAVFVLVAVLTAAATALVTWMLRPAPTPVPGAAGQVTDGQVAGGHVTAGDEHNDQAAPPAGSSSVEAPASAQTIVVAVVGHVVTPGLVTLPEGARVSDAIAAAGGALPGTDLSTINIARKVSDGEQIAVGVPGAANPATGSQAAGSQAAGTAGTGKVNINSASAEQLEELPGVGPVIAQAIIDFREENGPFASAGDLANVSGIGPATVAKLADLVDV